MATEWPLVLWALVIALETMIIAGLPSPRRFNLSARPTKLLMLPLILGAIPWMVYAVAMWDLNRQDRPDADVTVGIDHYSVQGAYGLALHGLVTLAAVWPAARLLAATCAGLSAVLPRCRLLGIALHPGEFQSDMVSTVRPVGPRGDPAGRPHPTTAIKIRMMTMRSNPKPATVALSATNERTAQHVRHCPEASGPASARLEAVRARSSGRSG